MLSGKGSKTEETIKPSLQPPQHLTSFLFPSLLHCTQLFFHVTSLFSNVKPVLSANSQPIQPSIFYLSLLLPTLFTSLHSQHPLLFLFSLTSLNIDNGLISSSSSYFCFLSPPTFFVLPFLPIFSITSLFPSALPRDLISLRVNEPPLSSFRKSLKCI